MEFQIKIDELFSSKYKIHAYKFEISKIPNFFHYIEAKVDIRIFFFVHVLGEFEIFRPLEPGVNKQAKKFFKTLLLTENS